MGRNFLSPPYFQGKRFMQKLLLIFGTRPEAIKLCPVIRALREHPSKFDVKVCVTAQHREMLDQVLEAFQVKPDYDLDLMLPGQTLYQSTSRILAGLEPILRKEKPAMAIVQGDTTTTLCGALAAFYSRIPVAHVEAGLRTYDLRQPFPEEMNRVVASRLTALHFAATEKAAENLRAEGIPADSIHVTGNTGIDAVLYVRDGLEGGTLRGQEWPGLNPSKKLIVVTAHRRRKFWRGIRAHLPGPEQNRRPRRRAIGLSRASQSERAGSGAATLLVRPRRTSCSFSRRATCRSSI